MLIRNHLVHEQYALAFAQKDRYRPTQAYPARAWVSRAERRDVLAGLSHAQRTKPFNDWRF